MTFTRHYPHWPPGVPKSLSVPRTSLFFNLEVSARRYPGKAALHYYGTCVTYAELLRSAEALAGYLQRACGVQRGDRVLLYTQNCPQFVIGTRDTHRGETVKAVVVLKPAARGKVQPADISNWAKEHMAAFKYPRVVEFVEQLPKTGTGKIFWRKLQEEENRRCGASS